MPLANRDGGGEPACPLARAARRLRGMISGTSPYLFLISWPQWAYKKAVRIQWET